jgi:predicted HAD superfamily Cof-like phosphohydrolase
MNNEQQMVKEFHEAFEIKIADSPTIQDEATKTLRLNLIDEEYDELKQGLEDNNLVEIADGLADMLYVLYGFAVTYGIDLEPVFAEVHRSNMSKVGGHKREDGKWISPIPIHLPTLRR